MKNISLDQFINYLIIGYAFAIVTTKAGTVLIEHLLIISFLFKGDFKNIYNQLKENKVIVTLFFFIALSLLSVTWSSDKTFALLYIKKYYHLLSIPIIYLYFNPKNIQHVFTSFLLGMLLSEVMSYSIFFELIKYQNVPHNNPSPFMNHIEYSVFLSFSAIILLNRVFFTEHKGYKSLYIIYFLTTTSNLFLNGGRTGQIIFIATLFVIIYLNIEHKIKAVLISLILSIGLVTTAYNVSPIFKVRSTQAYYDITKTFSENDYSGSFGQRVSLWIMGANVFSENILLGTGIGDEKVGMKKYAEKYNVQLYIDFEPHNSDIDYHSLYVQHAVQLGILGLSLMFYLMYCIFTVRFKSPIYQNINIAFSTSIFIYSIVGNILHSMVPMTFFAFFVGILIAISKHEHSSS